MGKPERTIGTCLLTGAVGPMAKSHIIPDAFMKRASDAPFKDWDGHSRPKKSYSGWYDRNIMTDGGEAITAKLDDVAAKCFIDNGFTYRTRRNPRDPGELIDSFIPGTVHIVSGIDVGVIRLFALSLLWRAAVSRLQAFEFVTVRPRRLEELRQRILSADPGHPDEFPVYFAFFCGQEELPKMAPFRFKGQAFYRFFLDGVVCNVSPVKKPPGVARFSSCFVGREKDAIQMVCMPSAESAHSRLGREGVLEASEKYGDIFGGLWKGER